MKRSKLISALSCILHELLPATFFASILPVGLHHWSHLSAFGHLLQAHAHTLSERAGKLVFFFHLPVPFYELFLLLRQAFPFISSPPFLAGFPCEQRLPWRIGFGHLLSGLPVPTVGSSSE